MGCYSRGVTALARYDGKFRDFPKPFFLCFFWEDEVVPQFKLIGQKHVPFSFFDCLCILGGGFLQTGWLWFTLFDDATRFCLVGIWCSWWGIRDVNDGLSCWWLLTMELLVAWGGTSCIGWTGGSGALCAALFVIFHAAHLTSFLAWGVKKSGRGS